MATMVLVHGAFGGAHTFRRVRPKLLAAGHDVFTPALSGIGERWHLASPQVTYRTHVEDVVNLIRYWDLREIVLVGYSYGGRVVSGALPEIADHVAHVVYLDCMLPELGVNLSPLTALLPPPGLGRPWLVDPPASDPSYFDDPDAAAFHGPRRTPQPIGTIAAPFVLERPLEDYPFTRTFVKATGEPRPPSGGPAWSAADRAKASPAWRYAEIATNHAIPENRPDELVELLLGLV